MVTPTSPYTFQGLDPSHAGTPLLQVPALSPCITPGTHQPQLPTVALPLLINFRVKALLFHGPLHLWLSQHCANINYWQLIKPILLWSC